MSRPVRGLRAAADAKRRVVIVSACARGVHGRELSARRRTRAMSSSSDRARIRELDPGAEGEIELVALRMRRTLEEVLGEEKGRALYTMDWLRERVRFHLDPGRSTAAVFLAESRDGTIAGHTIVRIDADADGRPIGLFSTTYVEPGSRRTGIAKQLLLRGEAWMCQQRMSLAVTDTSATNVKLIRLYEANGYTIALRVEGMVRLVKALGPSALG